MMQLNLFDSTTKLEMNLEVAFEAIKYVKSVLSYGAYNQVSLASNQTSLMHRIFKMRQETKFAIQNATLKTESEISFLIANFAKKYEIGNCGEQASLAYTYLRKKYRLVKLDRLTLINGDHAFLVIGRIPNRPIHIPNEWGNSAVVCDPWENLCYPASEIFFRMKSLEAHSKIAFNLNDQCPPFAFLMKRLYDDKFYYRSRGYFVKTINLANFLKTQIEEAKKSSEEDQSILSYEPALDEYLNLKFIEKI